MKLFALVLSLLLLLSFTPACQKIETAKVAAPTPEVKQTEAVPITQPPIGSPQKLAPGVFVYEVQLKNANTTSDVWIYLPEKPAQEKIPAILIAPAGSRLIDGMSLGEGDRDEHLPYVKAGFAVIAYSIDGEVADESEDAIINAAKAFQSSNAGLVNEKTALDYALAKFSAIDPNRIYVAGHSSAATHALLVGANEPRIKGVIAYAPATDIEKFVGEGLDALDDVIPGFYKFIAQSSPINNIAKIKVPVFLFHAQDDSTVPIAMTEDFANKLKASNTDVTLIEAKSGNHYNSMIKEGIPKAIEWLITQTGKAK